MKGFCVRQMRREYRGALRLCVMTTVCVLLLFAFLGVGLHVKQAAEKYRLLLIGLNPAAMLAFFGVYLILTDEKNLLRKTPFGQALRALGEPREVMRRIDESAGKRWEDYGSFTLLDGWLILYYADGWKYERQRTCALPISRNNIRGAEILSEYDPNDPERRAVRLILGDGTSRDFSVYQQRNLQILREWLGEQEQMTI